MLAGMNVHIEDIKIRPEQIELRDLTDIKPNPNNAKEHPRSQIDGIVQSIREFGWNDPIAVDEDGMVLEGHGRLLAAKRLNLVRVPVIVLSGLTEAQKRAYTIAHNQWTMNTGWDDGMLKFELESLQAENFDLGLTGFKAEEIDKLLATEEEAPLDDPLDNDGLEGLSQYRLSENLIVPPESITERYEWPGLQETRVFDPDRGGYDVWVGAHRTPDRDRSFWYIYGSDSTRGMPADRTTVAFYTDDGRFERVWNNLPKVTEQFIAAGITQLISPNFSLWNDMPLAERIWNTYRSRYCARYWQEAGLDVVPDIEWGKTEDLEWVLDGIPEGLPAIAKQIQTYGRQSGQDEIADRVRAELGLVLERVKPLCLVVYGGEFGVKLGAEIAERHNVEYVGVLNRSVAMRSDISDHEARSVLK